MFNVYLCYFFVTHRRIPLLFFSLLIFQLIPIIEIAYVFQAGTLAGNLSIKNEYNEFPSDLYLTMLTYGATIMISKHTWITYLYVQVLAYY